MFKLWTLLPYFTLIFISVVADDFLVVNHPASLEFIQNTAVLRLGQFKHVYNAVVGDAVKGASTFSTFKIKDVFKLPKLAFLMVIKTNVEDKVYTDVTTTAIYPVEARRPVTNLLAFDKNKIVYSLDSRTKEKRYTDMEGKLMELNFTNAKLLVQELRDLITTDKIKVVIVNIKKRKFISIHMDQKENVLEFARYKDTIQKLSSLLSDYFFGVLVYGPDSVNNGTSDEKTITVVDGTEFEHFNISPSYDENYAAIFNIILWFSVAFGLALVAAIMALINMDPGRDTIIYRMTARRSNKNL